MMRSFLMFVCLAAAAGASAQGIYRWTDAQGKVHYTSEPPPGKKANVVQPRVNSYNAAPSAQPAPATRPAAGAQAVAAAPAMPIVMYSTSWCPWCAKARAYFAKKGIAYTELDIEKSASANAEHKRLGGRGVPFFVVGREKMSGFSEEGLDALLARATR